MENDVLEPSIETATSAEAPKPPPPRSAPVEERRAWCLPRVHKIAAEHHSGAQNAPDDIRPGHLEQVELHDCISDPQAYDKATRKE